MMRIAEGMHHVSTDGHEQESSLHKLACQPLSNYNKHKLQECKNYNVLV